MSHLPSSGEASRLGSYMCSDQPLVPVIAVADVIVRRAVCHELCAVQLTNTRRQNN